MQMYNITYMCYYMYLLYAMGKVLLHYSIFMHNVQLGN